MMLVFTRSITSTLVVPQIPRVVTRSIGALHGTTGDRVVIGVEFVRAKQVPFNLTVDKTKTTAWIHKQLLCTFSNYSQNPVYHQRSGYSLSW